MNGVYPMGGRATTWGRPTEDDLSRYLRTEYRGTATRETFEAESRSRENGEGRAREPGIIRLVRNALLNLQRVKPTPAVSG